MLIYVAGPFSAPTPAERMENVAAACIAGRKVLARGHWCFISHLTEYFDRLPWTDPLTYADYMEWDLVLLARCDAILYLGPSPGADRERAAALRLGLPVYTSVEDLPTLEEGGRKGGPSCKEASHLLIPPGPDDWTLTVPAGPDSAAHQAVATEGETEREHGSPWWRWPHLRAHLQRRTL